MDAPGQNPGPHPGKPRDLSQPRQRDLTPDEANRVLKPQRKRQESRQDPVKEGRGTLEVVIYAVMLLAVVVFQLLSNLDPDAGSGRSPFADPLVHRVTIHNHEDGSQRIVEGSRVAKLPCADGEAVIETRIHAVEGWSFGDIRLETEDREGSWHILARGVLGGRASVHAWADVGCQRENND